jgi:hypothetical protein
MSGSSRQITFQLWPAIRRQLSKFPDWKIRESDHSITTKEGGQLIAFTTDEEGRAEGFHSEEGRPLLLVIDEAKSVNPRLFEAFDRCGYNVLLYISSPGERAGRFYEAFQSRQVMKFAAGLADCPHISRERIKNLELEYGPNSQFVRSRLHGEFMDSDEGFSHIIELSELEQWQENSTGFIDGPEIIGCDFAWGGADSNAIVHRIGNKLMPIVTFRDRDSVNAAGRFNREIRQMGYGQRTNISVYGDSGGGGKLFCDQLRAQGIRITDYNFGAKSNDPIFKNEGTRSWYQTAAMIRAGKIAPPPKDQESVRKLFDQLSNRRQKEDTGSGKVWMETKQEMRDRGLASPDIVDAFCMAFGVTVPLSYSYTPFDDSRRQEIAKKHGWDYTPDYDESYSDRRTWNRPGRNDDDFDSGFGGCHSLW